MIKVLVVGVTTVDDGGCVDVGKGALMVGS